MLRLARRSVAALVVAAVLATLPSPAGARSRHRVKIDRVERVVVRMINAVRRGHGLGLVRLDHRMSLGAGRHSRRMGETSYLTHGSTGRLLRYSGVRSVGEVIGWLSGRRPYGQAALIVRLWLSSPSHRPVLLSPRFSRVGVGRDATTGVTFFTVDFATG